MPLLKQSVSLSIMNEGGTKFYLRSSLVSFHFIFYQLHFIIYQTNINTNLTIMVTIKCNVM